MSTLYHTPHPFLGDVASGEFNSRLAELDAAIAAAVAAGFVGATTTLTAQALAGQPVLTVASEADFLVGDAVYIGTPGSGLQESGIIDSLAPLTLSANLANTHAVGTPVSRSPAEIVEARGIFATLGARLGPIEGRVFDVRRYGAVGDGVTDDAGAIQSAIDAAALVGGTVLIPDATHLVGSTLALPSGVTIRGAGSGARLLAADKITILKGDGVSHVVIDSLMLDGAQDVRDVTAADDADVILFYDSVACVVQHCHITRSARDAIAFRSSVLGSSASHGCAALNNRITDSQEDGITINGVSHRIIGNYLTDIWGDAILLKSASRCAVQGNTIVTAGAAGVSLGGDFAAGNTYNAVIGNTILDPAGAGIFVTFSDHSTVIGNTIKDGALQGVAMSDSQGCAFVGNTVVTVASHGFLVSSGVAAVLDGNTLSGVGGYAFSIAGGTRHRVSNNTVTGNALRAIQVTAVSCAVIGNSISGTTTAGEPGIRLAAADCIVEGNTIAGCTGAGIQVSSIGYSIVGNTVVGCGNRGITLGGGSSDGVCSNNLVKNNVGVGIFLDSVSNVALNGNRCHDTQGTKTQTWGIFSANTANFLCVVGNALRGNSTGGVSLVGANNVEANNVT